MAGPKTLALVRTIIKYHGQAPLGLVESGYELGDSSSSLLVDFSPGMCRSNGTPVREES